MTITMAERMWFVWAITIALGSLAMVTAEGSEEQLQLDNFPLDQSQIDQFLHNQILQAGLSTEGLGVSEGKSGKQITSGRPQAKKHRKAKTCRTPSGGEGLCLDLIDCPALILDFNALSRSVCFKSLFRPGVCCPIINDDPTTNTRPTTKKPTARPTTTKATTRPRPRPVPTDEPYPCGQPAVRDGRIINGTYTYPGEWPWAAALFLHGNKKTEFWCGGSLISKRYILTSAHCTRDSKGKTFSPLQFSVRLGDHNIFSLDDDAISFPQSYEVDNIKLHPDFKAHGFYNDLALLKLNRDVDFTDYIIPVCLPTDAMAQAPLDHMQGYMPTVVGWGRTIADIGVESPVLLKTRVPIWRSDPCDKAYSQPIEKTFLCAGFIEGGTDACQGDSGGPLTLFTGREWTQIGVVSFGNSCAKANQPGVYTRLTEFLPWIKLNADMV